MAHAKRSPSSAERWSICTMSVIEEAGKPDTSGDAAQWGTGNHFLSSTCLVNGKAPADYLGMTIVLHAQGESIIDPLLEDAPDGITLPIDDEQVACATSYVTRVRELVEQTGGVLHVEQRLPIDHITGEEGATGTGDIVIVTPTMLIAGDLKTGRNPVKATRPDGRMNLQCAMYLSGAARKHPGNYEKLVAMIFQPPLGSESEHTLTPAELDAEVEVLRAASLAEPVHAPSESTCKYCKAFPCAAADKLAIETTGFNDLDDAPGLGKCYGLIGFVRKWADAVEAKTRSNLEQSISVPGWKLVEGKLGARKWKDLEQAKTLLVDTYRLKDEEAYDRTLISPTAAEKLASDKTIGPRQWKKLQTVIEQPRNRPSIVAESDKRAPLAMDPTGFEADNSDLF